MRKGFISVSKKKYQQLQQDCDDMTNSMCTSFQRCPACGHVHDEGLVCPHCQIDTSYPEWKDDYSKELILLGVNK